MLLHARKLRVDREELILLGIEDWPSGKNVLTPRQVDRGCFLRDRIQQTGCSSTARSVLNASFPSWQ